MVSTSSYKNKHLNMYMEITDVTKVSICVFSVEISLPVSLTED